MSSLGPQNLAPPREEERGGTLAAAQAGGVEARDQYGGSSGSGRSRAWVTRQVVPHAGSASSPPGTAPAPPPPSALHPARAVAATVLIVATQPEPCKLRARGRARRWRCCCCFWLEPGCLPPLCPETRRSST